MNDIELRLELLEDEQLQQSMEYDRFKNHTESELGYSILRDAGLMLLFFIHFYL